MEQKKADTPGTDDVAISDEARAAAEKDKDKATAEGVPGAELEAELTEARAEAARNYDQYLRAAAELENFRKRAARERQDLARFANEGLLREFLPVIDNLERAVEHAQGQEGDSAGLLQGVEMTLQQFRQLLTKVGVVPIEAQGQPFDPNYHEAMGQVPSTEAEPNTVVNVMQRGYLLHDRLLRPAMVMIAAPPASPQDTDTTDSPADDAADNA